MIIAEVFIVMIVGAIPVLIGWYLTHLVIRAKRRRTKNKHHHDSELTSPRIRLVAVKDGDKITFRGKG